MTKEIRTETDFWGEKKEVIYENGAKTGEIRHETNWIGDPVDRTYDKKNEQISETRHETNWIGDPVDRTYDKKNEQISETRHETNWIGDPVDRIYDKKKSGKISKKTAVDNIALPREGRESEGRESEYVQPRRGHSTWQPVRRLFLWLVVPVVGIFGGLIWLGYDSGKPQTTEAFGGRTTTSPSQPDDSLVVGKMTIYGIGPVKVGMTVMEASHALSRPLVAVNSQFTRCDWLGPSGGPDGIRFLIIDGRIAVVNAWTRPFATKSGIQVGSRETDITQRYPNQIHISERKYSGGMHQIIFVPRDPKDSQYRVVFLTDRKTVQSISVGKLPEVEYSCKADN